jgi:broad specificity phosphatase PhoE
MITFVRHGEKLYDNGRSSDPAAPKFDPVLIEDFLHLPPHSDYYSKSNVVVYSSPYARTRQTAVKFSDEDAIRVDCRLGEYLGHWSKESINYETDFHPSMEGHHKTLPPPKETIQAMTARMFEFFVERCQELKDDPNKHIIVVSHGYPILSLFRRLTEYNPKGKYSKKISYEAVEGFTVSLYEKDIIPTKLYSYSDRNWCNCYSRDYTVPLSEEILELLRSCECDV